MLNEVKKLVIINVHLTEILHCTSFRSGWQKKLHGTLCTLWCKKRRKNKASSCFQGNVFAFQGKPLRALLNASQSLPPRDGGRCVASGYSWAMRVQSSASDNPLSIGWGSLLRFRVYCMVGRAKPVRPCHRDVVETCYRDFRMIVWWYKDTKFSPLLQVSKNLFHLYQDISGH